MATDWNFQIPLSRGPTSDPAECPCQILSRSVEKPGRRCVQSVSRSQDEPQKLAIRINKWCTVLYARCMVSFDQTAWSWSYVIQCLFMKLKLKWFGSDHLPLELMKTKKSHSLRGGGTQFTDSTVLIFQISYQVLSYYSRLVSCRLQAGVTDPVSWTVTAAVFIPQIAMHLLSNPNKETRINTKEGCVYIQMVWK